MNDCQPALDDLLVMIRVEPKKIHEGNGRASTAATEFVPRDGEVMAKLAGADNAAKVRRLLDGDTSDYPSASEADLALASVVGFWTRDADQIERIMRSSKLCRDKWDQHSMYLMDTITKAMANGEHYDWDRQKRVSNIIIVAVHEDGEKVAPKPMQRVMDDLLKASGDWPRRVDNALFVDDSDRGVCWLERTSALFGWLARKHGIVDWRRSTGCVSKEELFAEMQRTAKQYEAIENLPHEPMVSGHYYTCGTPTAGDGKAIDGLLDYFHPETPLDRQLMTALLTTPLWGGPAGARPAWMITSAHGRGRGKTRLATFVGRLFGGFIDISPNEDIGTVKARLLSPESASLRIALLDNVKTHRFSWGELENLITTSTISGKRMYVGEARRPNLLTWVITLNGASLSTDLAQRIVEIQLADPNYRPGWDEEVGRFIDDRRDEIIGDLIALLQRPTRRLRRHTRWSTWEAEVLSRVAEDPDGCIDLILDRRGTADVEAEEATIIEDYFREKIDWLDYDPQTADVFIPSDITARWFNQAVGERQKTAAVSRILRQLHDEGKLWRIIPARQGSTGRRGVRWVGDCCDAAAPIDHGILRRLADKTRKQEGWDE